MGIKSELHEAILKRGGKVPPYGGIAAAMDELNKLPGGSGVSSWNDLTDKPFGTEIGQGVAFNLKPTPAPEGRVALSGTVKLFEGEQYAVNYRGDTYNCVAQAIDMGDDIVAFVLGNIGAAMGGEDSGEPFVFMADEASRQILIMDLTGVHFVSMTITGLTEIVTHIDEKYLPDGMAPVRYVDFKVSVASNGNVSYSCDMSFYGVVMLIAAGTHLVARMQADSGSVFFNIDRVEGNRITFVRTAYNDTHVECERIAYYDTEQITVQSGRVEFT